jgi:sugar-specific transcriptional regulator TrmB
MFKKILKEIGLTENEIKVYNALIKIGKSPTGKIIKESKITGSKIYEVLDKLIDKGLVSSTIENKWRLFQITSPEAILIYLDDKQKTIEDQKQDAKQIISQIEKQMNIDIKDSKVTVFKGFEGIKTMYTDIDKTLKKGETWMSMGASGQPEHWEIYFTKVNKARDDRGIKSKHIFDEAYKKLYEDRKKWKNTEIRFFENSLMLSTSTEIYANKVIITVLVENGIGILIENEKIAESFRKQFNYYWNRSKKPSKP